MWQAFLFWLDDSLEGNFEIHVSGVNGDFFDFGFSYIAGEGFFDVSDAIVYIRIRALGKHLDSTIRTVADRTGQLMTVGYVKSSEAKADTLDSADENYMFGCLAHFPLYINPGPLILQVCVLSVDNSQRD